MEKFDIKEAISKLDSNEKETLNEYRTGLEKALDNAEFSSKDRKSMYDTLMDFRACYMCMDHYKNKYNEQAKKVQDLIDHPYKGTDYKKLAEYANTYSYECAVLQNLEREYERYRSIKINMENKARKADEKLDARLAERGHGQDFSNKEKNTKEVQKQPSQRK